MTSSHPLAIWIINHTHTQSFNWFNRIENSKSHSWNLKIKFRNLIAPTSQRLHVVSHCTVYNEIQQSSEGWCGLCGPSLRLYFRKSNFSIVWILKVGKFTTTATKEEEIKNDLRTSRQYGLFRTNFKIRIHTVRNHFRIRLPV